MQVFNNASLANVLVTVVLSFLQNKKTFSAFEVTTEIRRMYPQYAVLHSAVRVKTHDLYNKGFFKDYERYDNGNFIQYRPLVKQSLVSSLITSLATLKSTKGNVRLPVTLTRKLGLSPGDKVDVSLNGVYKTFTVDVYGNVKISTPNKTFDVVNTNQGLELKSQ